MKKAVKIVGITLILLLIGGIWQDRMTHMEMERVT